MRRQLLKEFLLEKEKLLVNIKNTLFSSKVLENFYYFKDVYIINSLKDYASVINLLILDYYCVKENKNFKNKIQVREKYIFRGLLNFEQLKPTIVRKKDC